MKHKELLCHNCGCVINFDNICCWRHAHQINGARLKKGYCIKCGIKQVDKMKREYFVETYNEHDIYTTDGKFFPYWGCHYFFTRLEDCKTRIDAKEISVLY